MDRLTTVDWRANRLADSLAKQAAAAIAVSRRTARFLASARLAVVHAACGLGQVTHAANNHTVQHVDPDGTTRTTTIRDAEPAPRRDRRPRADHSACSAPAPGAKAGSMVLSIRPWTPPPPRARPFRARCPERARARERSAGALRRCIDGIGASLASDPHQQPAAHRLVQVQQRVRQRINEAMAADLVPDFWDHLASVGPLGGHSGALEARAQGSRPEASLRAAL